jgi:hypothetical protein
LWVIFALLDSDPDSQSGSGSTDLVQSGYGSETLHLSINAQKEHFSDLISNKCVIREPLIRFQLAYCNLLKSNMDGLKRQKKQKTKKAIQD